MVSLFYPTIHSSQVPVRQRRLEFQLTRKVFFCLSVLTCLLLIKTAIAVADDGGELFRRNCGSCHQRGGKARVVNPADKAEVVWEKYFKRDRHPVKLSTITTAGELSTILEYLQRHAADSDSPEAAAIPK